VKLLKKHKQIRKERRAGYRKEIKQEKLQKKRSKREHKSIQEKKRKERNAIGTKNKYQRGKERQR
jgi:hypothetical protein